MPKRIAQRLGRVAPLGETAELCFEPALQGLRYVKDPATIRLVTASVRTQTPSPELQRTNDFVHGDG